MSGLGVRKGYPVLALPARVPGEPCLLVLGRPPASVPSAPAPRPEFHDDEGLDVCKGTF